MIFLSPPWVHVPAVNLQGCSSGFETRCCTAGKAHWLTQLTTKAENTPLGREIIFQAIILRFYVNPQGCTCFVWFRLAPLSTTWLDFATFGEPSQNPGRFLWAERTQGTTSRPVDTYSVDGFNPQQKIDATTGFHCKSPGFLGGHNLYLFMGLGAENGI